MARNIKSMEKKWQIEEDARTMARYQEIMADTKRKNAAIREANRIAKNLEDQAKTMKLATGGRLKK